MIFCVGITDAECGSWSVIAEDGSESVKPEGAFLDLGAPRLRWFLGKEKPAAAVERVVAYGQTFWGVPA